jgi:DNA ligase-associated metallophosphoesterase
MQNSFSIQFLDQSWQALQQKALFWINQKALLISDLHLGRAAHLRKHGYALSEEAHSSDLSNIESLINNYEARIIYVLGDLFHSHTLGDISGITKLIKDSGLEWILIKGNHDVFKDEIYFKLGFAQVLDELIIDKQFLLKHEPSKSDLINFFCISGHLHPGYRLYGKAKQSITLPCFYFGDRQIILPAMGMLTGLYRLKQKSKKEVFVVCHPGGVQPV